MTDLNLNYQQKLSVIESNWMENILKLEKENEYLK